MRLHPGETEAVGRRVVTVLQRLLVVRDGDSPEQLEHVANWLLEELPFMLREHPWARATMIVAGPPQIDHDPDTELVVAPPTSPRSQSTGGGSGGSTGR
jgi:hypothetical protein